MKRMLASHSTVVLLWRVSAFAWRVGLDCDPCPSIMSSVKPSAVDIVVHEPSGDVIVLVEYSAYRESRVVLQFDCVSHVPRVGCSLQKLPTAFVPSAVGVHTYQSSEEETTRT